MHSPLPAAPSACALPSPRDALCRKGLGGFVRVAAPSNSTLQLPPRGGRRGRHDLVPGREAVLGAPQTQSTGPDPSGWVGRKGWGWGIIPAPLPSHFSPYFSRDSQPLLAQSEN